MDLQNENTVLYFLNHSSILLHSEGHFLLTDPWLDTPAFGCWLPVPPMALHPAYLVTLAKTAFQRFCILISHGHDDHIDDRFLSKFPDTVPILVPKYVSKGLYFRVKNIGFKNIIEVDEKEPVVGPFKLSSYYDLSNSYDDAMVAVETKKNLLVHANDNWKEMTPDSLRRLTEKVDRVGGAHSAYLSQCNIADGFPYIYPQYSAQEQTKVAVDRIANMTRSSLKNAISIGAKYFINYAGHTKSFVRENPELARLTGYKTHEFICQQLQSIGGDELEILDMIPGDCFNFSRVQKMFFETRLDDELLKEETVRFYQESQQIDRCISYQKHENELSDPDRRHLLEQFLTGFHDFVMARVDKKSYRPAIKEQNFSIKEPTSGLRLSVNFQTGQLTEDPEEPSTTIIVSSDLLDQILQRRANVENLTIGGACLIEKRPRDFYSGDLQFWLSMYGYYYQRTKV